MRKLSNQESSDEMLLIKNDSKEGRLPYGSSRASLVAQLVKNPPAMQETPVQFLDREDPLEKGMATHSSTLRLL